MLHTCLNCGCLSCLTIPRELVEQQLGWKQDMPLKRKVLENHRQEDLRNGTIYLCKECCLNIIKLEAALNVMLTS